MLKLASLGAGALAVKRVNGVPTVFPAEGGHVAEEENLLETVYNCGPVKVCRLTDGSFFAMSCP